MRAMLMMMCVLVSHLACAAEPAGVVLATTGTITVVRNQKTLPVARRTTLEAHDELHTGNDARAQLRFADGTLTTLGANTVFRIDQYQWQAKSTQAATAKFALVEGAFRTLTGHLLDTAGARFEVTTPTGILGIRGTDFWGGYLEPGKVDVLLIHGDHAVNITNQSGTVLLAHPGEGVTLTPDQSPLQIKVWPQTKVDRAVATIAWPGSASEQPEKF